MRSACELAQDSIPSPASSTNPAVPASSIFLRVVPQSVCSDPDLILDGVSARAFLAGVAGGLGNDRAPVHGTGSQIKGADGEVRAAAQFLRVDTAAIVRQGGERRLAACAYPAPGNWMSKNAMCRVGAPGMSVASPMT